MRKDKKADLIIVQNTYYSEISPGNFSVFEAPEKRCSNSASCRQREYAFGAAIEIPFPGGDTIDNLLPIDGVITRHEIQLEGQAPLFALTAKGKHPDPGPPVIQ